MQLSKRTQYGLRAIICLADNYDRGYLQTRALAAREKLPAKFLESILATLTREKILISRIGVAGGYRLAKPPKDISVGDVVARLEGKLLLEDEVAPGQRPGEIAISLIHKRLSDAVLNVLNATSLAQLAEQIAANSRSGQMYYI
jgi:Rrf2 family cysteine metabolism transcriptional repressor